MEQLTIKKNEYVLFVYLCMANADNHIDLKEIDLLFDKLDVNLFDQTNSNELLVSLVYKKYKKMTQDERLALIKNNAIMHLENKETAVQLMSNLAMLIHIDGKVESNELALYNQLNKIFVDEFAY